MQNDDPRSFEDLGEIRLETPDERVVGGKRRYHGRSDDFRIVRETSKCGR